MLYLIRGLPGSGKSTLAHTLCARVVEADQFFMVDGVYRFDREKLAEAHQWCLSETDRLLRLGFAVAVANTFTRRSELVPYLALADKLRVQLVVLTVETALSDEELAHRTVHGVPVRTITAMRQRWEPYQNFAYLATGGGDGWRISSAVPGVRCDGTRDELENA